MRTLILKRAWQALGQAHFVRSSWSVTVLGALLLAATSILAGPTVSWVSGGPNTGFPTGAGYADGDTVLEAEYHTPCGIAMDVTGQYLFVADRDNNAIRYLDLAAGLTWTFDIALPNLVSKPVGVAIDNVYNVYVLNYGKGTNGSVVTFDNWGDAVATNATRLTNAAGIALDGTGNIYVTASNTLFRIAGTNRTVIVTVTNAGASLRGIVVKQNGLIAACDSGRNGIYLIDPNTGLVTTNAGFHGAGDFNTNGNNVASSSTAKFNQPMSVAETGDGSLIVTDFGNHRVKRVLTTGVVTNLYGVPAADWVNPYKGFMDGTVTVPDALGGVAARSPFGVVFAPDGTVYTTEDYYHIVRKVTGASLTLMPTPPPPPPVPPAPMIGWFDYEGDLNSGFFTFFHQVTNTIVLHNDATLAIDPGTVGVSTYYIDGPAPLAATPNASNGSTPPPFQNSATSATALPVTTSSNLVVKAVSVNSIGQSSPVATAQFIYQVANPTIVGNNGAQFTISDITSNVVIWFTIDGTDPSNAPPTQQITITNGNLVTLSLNVTTNITFQARGYRSGYLPSGIASTTFSGANFVPNTISFGFAAGEGSSDFVASPGQTFYAPVTFTPLSSTKVYSLQFNLTVTNLGINPIASGAFDFRSLLIKPVVGNLYETIPPYMFINTNASFITNIVQYDGSTNWVSLLVTNLTLNQLGVGWLERAGATNLYNTAAQDLIQFSQAHDNLFDQGSGKVILGGFNFSVPVNADAGDTYQIRIGRPSATSDGVGAPGSSVYIYAPTNGGFSGGTVNAIKNVTIGQIKYIVGNVYKFRWFNAGDFGNNGLQNADVEQVFEAAVYGLNSPRFQAPGSDFFDAMDSCGSIGVLDGVNGYYTNAFSFLSAAQKNILFDGDANTVNTIAFGDGNLDVCDVFVTYLRSQFENYTWYTRFWTNGVRVAQTTANTGVGSSTAQMMASGKTINGAPKYGSTGSTTNQPKVIFTAGDCQTNSGATIQIPITASILGVYPLRLLMLSLDVVPLDGSPALTTQVSFAANSSLGTPWPTTGTNGYGSYAAVWLNNSILGLSNNVTIGTLTVTLPAGASSSSAYAVVFDHASASPNGLASFPKQTRTGLITLANRSSSSYHDGIPDAWRLRYFLTLNNYLSATNADADGDGLNNLQEYLAGTDPTDAKSFFKNISPAPSSAWQPNDCVISWPSAIGKQYIIERTPILSTPFWSSIATNNGTGNTMEYHDLSGGANGYYRVRVQ